MKKGIFLLSSLLLSNYALAISNDLPSHCEYGRQTHYDVSYEEVASAIEDGLKTYANPYDFNSWKDFYDSMSNLLDSFDYLRIETTKHVLQGSSFRAKGNLFDRYAYVHFHNSEKGFIGKDKSNLDANSYLNMSFDKTYGYGLVWITRDNLCSAEGVWVQKNPTASKRSASVSGQTFSASVSYAVDKYSKAAKDNNTPVKVTFILRSDLYGTRSYKSTTSTANSGVANITMKAHAGGGVYDLSAIVYDGNYGKSVQLGSFIASGDREPPCRECQPN
ncbi:hypothetical protein [Pseudoalteromonas byunsanensis]|uniref:Uncharacterized protein n=1 Tax=Pseudoalteromonas byunsanensis TaxID=327939 RepID=A0A1S1N757_9GAMM|nr:hypothetical protein [Pseudoalteromonas byunsanensis]OHU94492.1 hypothetical protein BIW53_15590 [Pseudoalteromonas byunsanensis]